MMMTLCWSFLSRAVKIRFAEEEGGRFHDFDTICRRGLIIDDQTEATNRPDVFAGGDCVTGSKSVVHAVAAG